MLRVSVASSRAPFGVPGVVIAATGMPSAGFRARSRRTRAASTGHARHAARAGACPAVLCGCPTPFGESVPTVDARVECGVPRGRRSRQAFFAKGFRLGPACLGPRPAPRARPPTLRSPRFTIVGGHTPISSSRPPPPTSSAAPSHDVSLSKLLRLQRAAEHRRSVRATLTPSAVRSLLRGAPARSPGPPPPRRRRRPTSRRPSSTPSSSRTTPGGRSRARRARRRRPRPPRAAAAAALRPLLRLGSVLGRRVLKHRFGRHLVELLVEPIHRQPLAAPIERLRPLHAPFAAAPAEHRRTGGDDHLLWRWCGDDDLLRWRGRTQRGAQLGRRRLRARRPTSGDGDRLTAGDELSERPSSEGAANVCAPSEFRRHSPRRVHTSRQKPSSPSCEVRGRRRVGLAVAAAAAAAAAAAMLRSELDALMAGGWRHAARWRKQRVPREPIQGRCVRRIDEDWVRLCVGRL